jgi:alpha-1,2-mannosyltransferase
LRAAVETLGQVRYASNRPSQAVLVAAQRIFEVGVFGFIPVLIPLAMVAYLVGTYDTNGLLLDFRVMWDAGTAVLQGHSPYGAGVHTAYPFVYPAPAAFLTAPLTLLPWKAAVAIFWLVSATALMVALYLLDVEDWRCYGAVFASIATVWALEVGTLTPLLTLSVAVAWRYRDRLVVVSTVIAAAILTKLFLWPLVIWLLVTKRFRTAFATCAAFLTMTIGGWAVIGFAGFLEYPHYLRGIASNEQYESFSTLALGRSLGLAPAVAHIAAVVVAMLALTAVAIAARGPAGDKRSFIWAIGASLLISPIVWAHYFVLVFVPIAMASRRLTVLWLLPLSYWILPHTASGGSAKLIMLGTGITLTALILSNRFATLDGIAQPGSRSRRVAETNPVILTEGLGL